MSNFFELFPSRIYLAILLTVYAVAILLGFILFREVWMGVLLAVLLCAALVYYLCRDVWLWLPSSYVKILPQSGSVILLRRDGAQVTAQLARDSLVTPVLIILNLLPLEGRSLRSVIIFPDSMEKEPFRALRVLLKWDNDFS